MKRFSFCFAVIVCAVFFLPSHLLAQRIGVGDVNSDTRTTEANHGSNSASTRIIPPEEFGKYRNQQGRRNDLSKNALIEKLRADSASMRIRFQEKLQEVKSDSRVMRKKIKKLRKTLRTLRGKLRKLQTSDQTGGVSPDTAMNPVAGTAPVSGSISSKSGGPSDTQTVADTPQQLTEDVALNPNTASLTDLKAVPGLSDRLAERLQWYRREVRPFESLADLKRVPGIDQNVYDDVKKYFSKGPY